MEIKKYEAYFHDGRIEELEVFENNIILTVGSAHIDPEENEDNITLTRFNQIRGRLHLNSITNLTINNISATKEEIVRTDYGSILDLEFHEDNVVLLNVDWYVNDNWIFQSIKCSIKSYFFENLPLLTFRDDADFDDNGRYIGEKR